MIENGNPNHWIAEPINEENTMKAKGGEEEGDLTVEGMRSWRGRHGRREIAKTREAEEGFKQEEEEEAPSPVEGYLDARLFFRNCPQRFTPIQAEKLGILQKW